MANTTTAPTRPRAGVRSSLTAGVDAARPSRPPTIGEHQGQHRRKVRDRDAVADLDHDTHREQDQPGQRGARERTPQQDRSRVDRDGGTDGREREAHEEQEETRVPGRGGIRVDSASPRPDATASAAPTASRRSGGMRARAPSTSIADSGVADALIEAKPTAAGHAPRLRSVSGRQRDRPRVTTAGPGCSGTSPNVNSTTPQSESLAPPMLLPAASDDTSRAVISKSPSAVPAGDRASI